MLSAVSITDLNNYFLEVFPADAEVDRRFILLEMDRAIIRVKSTPKSLRPGGMFSGPTQMTLADITAYAAIFTRIGIVPMAVTSALSINFLRPCIGDAIEADARIIKFGRSSVVLEVKIQAVGAEEIASHAIVNYVVPDKLGRHSKS